MIDLITNDMKHKDEISDKSSTRTDVIPNVAVDIKSINTKVAGIMKKKA